jgi:integrase
MRRGELVRLTWRCTDLAAGRVSVEQQLVTVNGQTTFGPPKSGRGWRSVALDSATVAALERHRDTQLVERAFAGDAYDDHDLVFCDELGRLLPPQRLTDAFGRHRRGAGLPTGTLHVLRHTAASLLLADGVPLHVVAARLGDDPATVLAVYAHPLPQSDELAAGRIAALLV